MTEIKKRYQITISGAFKKVPKSEEIIEFLRNGVNVTFGAILVLLRLTSLSANSVMLLPFFGSCLFDIYKKVSLKMHFNHLILIVKKISKKNIVSDTLINHGEDRIELNIIIVFRIEFNIIIFFRIEFNIIIVFTKLIFKQYI